MNDHPHDAVSEDHGTAHTLPPAYPEHDGLTNGTNGATPSERDLLIRGAATVGVVGVGVALFEVALIPGMIIGVAAALAPKYLPQIGAGLQPMFRSTVRNLYKFNRKTREAVAEASEKVKDIVAEVHAEGTAAAPAAPAAPAEPAATHHA